MILSIDQQVTSREISEELKARGVTQESLFYHCFYAKGTNSKNKYDKLEYGIFTKDHIDLYENECGYCFEVFCSAYTVSEIISMLIKGYPEIKER